MRGSLIRSLVHHWRMHAAVAAAVAVCAAVLTGALLVGDSVRGSLRDLTLDRLGHVDLALAADRFFRRELVDELRAAPGFADAFDAAVPAILLRGSVEVAGGGARATGVNVLGVDDDFLGLFEQPPVSRTFAAGAGPGPTALDFSRGDGQVFPSTVINDALAAELSVAAGDQILIRFQLGAQVPRDTLLGERQASEVLATLRVTVREVVPARGAGRFDLDPHQSLARNAYVPLERLQAALQQPRMVNGILVSRAPGGDAGARPPLDELVGLQDMGLRLAVLQEAAGGPVVEVQSQEFVLRPLVRDAVADAATSLEASLLELQAYLANRLQVGDRSIPYSMVLALDPPAPGSGAGELLLLDGSPAPSPGAREILLNSWAAEELQAGVGDRLQMTYYVVGPDEELTTRSATFTVAGTVAMRGLAVDAELSPDYPGIQGVENMTDWDPPFPVDLESIRPRDETYWDEYGAAPKAFVSAATGRELWSTRYGAVTSARLAPRGGSPEELLGALSAELRERLDPAAFGFRFLEVKRQGLEASSGATDFGGLFIGFSFFLIASAVMIVGLLFALGIGRRAREIGLLRAVGYARRAVRGRLLAEGALVAALGATVGLVGAVAYGRLLILGLTTLWLPAVGSPLLFLYVSPSTLALGWMLSLGVALASIAWSLRVLGRVPVTGLLKGSFRTSAGRRGRSARWQRVVAGVAGLSGAGLLAYGLASGAAASPAVAFGSGAALLVAGVAGFASWCQRPRGRLSRAGTAAALAMAARNSGWSPGRSILSVALVASAAFVIVVVAGNVRDPESESETVAHGAGGYALLATSDVSIHGDLDSPGGRLELGLDEERESLLGDTHIAQLRLLPGDDASCLNLYRPQRPRLLGVPPELRGRGGFRWGATLAEQLGVGSDPWELLGVDLGPGVIAAVGDANSTQWILHLGLGDELTLQNEHGEDVRLRLVGTLRESIFQSELLVSEEAFLEHFPSRSGFGYFLIDTPEGRVDEVAAALEDGLGRFGFDAVSSARTLAGFLVVQNTYLSTFLMLGGLGLLLGTVGLAIILVRNVLERRGELATLRAFGFRRAFLTRMVLAENAFLLGVGVAIGSLAALAAISPRYLLGAADVPWATLLPTLAAVLAVGMLASSVAVLTVLRVPLLPALKAEG